MTYRAILLRYMRQHDRAWVISLIALVCLIYLPFLGNPFIFDDFNFFQGDTPSYYAHTPFNFDLRWLSYASLGWTYSVFSDVQPHFYRAGNLILHAANVIALFYVLRQWVTAVIPEYKETQSVVLGAWLAALVFAIHPVAVYAVGYVIQRSILLATLFVLLMQLAYLRGLLTGQTRWLVLTVIAYFMAVFSKEHSVMAPALLIALTILVREKIRPSRPALLTTWLAMAGVGILIVLRAKGAFGTPYEVGANGLFEQMGVVENTLMLHLLSVLTQAGLFFKYLLLWLLPNPAWMSVDMREPFVASMSAWQSWIGAIGFLVYGAVGIRLLLRSGWGGLAGLGLLYPWLLFIVEFSSIRVQEPFILYRSYLWMPGTMIFIPLMLARWPGRKFQILIGLILLLMVPLTVNRLWVFADNFRLWDDAAKLLHTGNEPLASRIYYNRGFAKASLGKWAEAIPDYEMALAKNVKVDPIILHDLGVAYFNTRRLKDALVQFDRAIALMPDYAKAYYDKGMTLKLLGEKDLAMQQMIKSCEYKFLMACLIVQVNPEKK